MLIVEILDQVLVDPMRNPWSAGSWERAPPAWGEGRQRLGRSTYIIGSNDNGILTENSMMDIHDLLLHRAAVLCDNQHVAVVAKKKTLDS